MPEPDSALPLIARLTVYALGSTDDDAVRQPVDQVAAWMLDKAPSLEPDNDAAAAYSTIRVRTSLVDRMVVDEATRAGRAGDRLAVWVLGGGLGARWYRLRPALDGQVAAWREVEAPGVLAVKDELLADSPFAVDWARVERRAALPEGWTVRPVSGARTLVVCEGLAGRMTPDALRRLLERIRFEVPAARVILGLPGYATGEQPTWTHHRLTRMGFDIEEDLLLGPRSRLVNPRGGDISPGLYATRLLLLAGRVR